MAGEPIPLAPATASPAPIPAAAPSPVAAPAPAAVASLPVAGATIPEATPAPVTTAPVPVAEPAKPAEASPAIVEPPTLLGGDNPKPAEAEKTPEKAEGAEGEKVEAEKPVEEAPKPLPAFESFTLPEGTSADPESLKTFTEALGEFENTTGADHAHLQGLGQKIVEMGLAEVKRATEKLYEYQVSEWKKQSDKWIEDFEADPELGGNRRNTTLDDARYAINNFAGTPEQVAAFNKYLHDTKMGNNPALIRAFSNLGKALREGKPLAASIAPKAPQSKLNTLYGNSMKTG